MSVCQKLSIILENEVAQKFQQEMVFCYQNCSDLLWEKLLKFEAEGRELEFSKILWSLEQFIEIVKGQNNFW